MHFLRKKLPPSVLFRIVVDRSSILASFPSAVLGWVLLDMSVLGSLDANASDSLSEQPTLTPLSTANVLS